MAGAVSPGSLTAPPRIVFVLRYHLSRVTGGAEVQAWLLATELARRGWDAHYASEMPALKAPTVLDGVTLHGLPDLPDPIAYWRGNRAPVAALLAQLQPAVVYSRVFDPYVGYVALGAPPGAFRIWAAASRYDGRRSPLLAAGARGTGWNDFLRRLPVYLHWEALARLGRRRAHLILAQQREQQTDLARLGLASELLRNSHPPVPESAVQSHRGPPTVLWADTLKPLKRPEIFLELARRCRDLDADFVMAGRIDPAARCQTLLSRAQQDLPRFRYLGFVPLDRINTHFRAAHLHIKTSLPIEGLPNTFIQAWLHGVPVVSLEVDLEGRLASGELGHCAATLPQLEAAVRRLSCDPAARLTIGARARAFAQSEFNLASNVTRLEHMLAARGLTPPALHPLSS